MYKGAKVKDVPLYILSCATQKRATVMVLVVGLEPTRCHQHRILSPTRLPFHQTSTILTIKFICGMADRLTSAERSERHDRREYSTTPAQYL